MLTDELMISKTLTLKYTSAHIPLSKILLYLGLQLIVSSFSYATDFELTQSISCDSLNTIVEDIFINEKTFTDHTQEIANDLLLLIQNKDCSSQADALTLLGTIHYNLNEPKKSKQYFNAAMAIIDDKLATTKTATRAYLAYGLLYIAEKNHKSAEFYFNKASRISHHLNDSLGIFSAHLNLGLCYTNAGRLDEAKAIFFETESIIEGIDNKELVGYIYQNLARIYIAEKNYTQAIANTQKAYSIWENIDFKKGMFFCNSNFALIYEEQKDSTLWVEYLTKLIQYTGKEKAFIRHYPYMKLGNYHFAKHNYSESKTYYELALKQSNTIAENELLSIISNLHTLYNRDNDLESIKKINNEVLAIYAYKSDVYTTEAEKWLSTEVELEEKLKENKELKVLNFDYLNKIKLRNILLVLLFVLLNGGLFYFQRYRYQNKLLFERRQSDMRNKISRDLHDDVGTILAGISSQAQLLEIFASNEIQPSDNTEIISSANKIVEGSQEAMDNMRDTVWAMDTRNDTLISLKFKLLDFLRYTMEPKDIEYECIFNLLDENSILTPTVRQAAYLIFKESIVNIIKHSDTGRVDISLSTDKNSLHVSIQDYGQEKADLQSSGQGLKNMALRAESLEGSYSFNYKDGYVTEYTLPLSKNSKS